MVFDSKSRLQVERELLESVQQIRTQYEDLIWEYWGAMEVVGDIGPGGPRGTLALVQSLEKRLHSAIERLQRAA